MSICELEELLRTDRTSVSRCASQFLPNPGNQSSLASQLRGWRDQVWPAPQGLEFGGAQVTRRGIERESRDRRVKEAVPAEAMGCGRTPMNDSAIGVEPDFADRNRGVALRLDLHMEIHYRCGPVSKEVLVLGQICIRQRGAQVAEASRLRTV